MMMRRIQWRRQYIRGTVQQDVRPSGRPSIYREDFLLFPPNPELSCSTSHKDMPGRYGLGLSELGGALQEFASDKEVSRSVFVVVRLAGSR